MRTLRLRHVGWCEAHCHPVATLAVDGDSAFIGVAISAADAHAISAAAIGNPHPRPGEPVPENTRLYALIELVASSLGGRVTAIDLAVGQDRIVRSWFRLDGPLGSSTVPASFSDALVLSQRVCLPLRIESHSFDRLRGGSDRPTESTTIETSEETTTPPHNGLDPFREFIDGLDMESIG